MSSISTTKGDGGETGLAGGVRVSKASARVETYGTIDELIPAWGSRVRFAKTRRSRR